jgi:integral membrane protein
MNDISPQPTSQNDNKPIRLGATQQAALNWMRVISWAEGASFLLLLFIAMPLKYIAGNPEPVRVVGSIHGGLFLLYCATAVGAAFILRWRWTQLLLALIASVLPFGPFVFEARLRRQYKQA